ncbi:hypothetical protein [Novosphingobium sp. KA1]|uniref:hypothetical protein n=1 Tax=Novosphingobium sp. (strain KA1) TaxID=164608 RepID=UPI001A8D5AAC|nr:hypothetical protein [Novosphingobium sp. KA1]QSR18442.1 hypothetical protein CA833_14805 [Novosphingobium sp. KA1]
MSTSDDSVLSLRHLQIQYEKSQVELDAARQLLKGGGGDGISGGMSDDWRESVDRQLGQLHSDVRALLNRGVAAVVALALMIGGLYIYFNEKFEKVSDRLTAVERKMDAIDVKLDVLVENSKPSSKP